MNIFDPGHWERFDENLMFYGPSALGLSALAIGIHILRKKRLTPRPMLTTIFGWLLIATFFGIGSCYAVVLPYLLTNG